MFATKWLGILGAVAMVGVAAPAMAHDCDPAADSHYQYHRELDQEHALQHEQLQLEHAQEHAREAQEHAALHAAGWGNDPFSHWLMHRRLARQHRLEHIREAMQHARDHARAEAEHSEYHGQADPYFYGGGYQYAPAPRDYWNYR
jgi:hypothetical protein